VADFEHWHYDVFPVTWKHPILGMAAMSFVKFRLDDDGEVTELEVTSYDSMLFSRVMEPPAQ
jgi:hypothetical protein